VQARLQLALKELLGEPVSVVAAGRTDSGVHARGQVVAFDTARTLPTKAYWMGLNGMLPDDIAVVSAEEVDPSFDPRRWASGKRYRYRVSNKRTRSPLRRLTHWEIFLPLALPAMQEAAKCLVTRTDFSAFRAADCQASHAVRELRKIEITGTVGDELSLVFEGTAFLKHMVRNLTGTLLEVGRSRESVEWVKQVLDGRDRTAAGPTAPAHGLCLEEVFYGPGPREDEGDDE
jgi:tRNA pseudouridine38-40 synthase